MEAYNRSRTKKRNVDFPLHFFGEEWAWFEVGVTRGCKWFMFLCSTQGLNMASKCSGKLHFLIFPEQLSKIGPLGIMSQGTKNLASIICRNPKAALRKSTIQTTPLDSAIQKTCHVFTYVLKKYAYGSSFGPLHGSFLCQDQVSYIGTNKLSL